MNQPTTDADDHFVAVDAKLESEMDEMEDQLENNGPEWTSRVWRLQFPLHYMHNKWRFNYL